MRIALPLSLVVAGCGTYPIYLVSSAASVQADTLAESAALADARPLVVVLGLAAVLIALIGAIAALSLLGLWGPFAQEVAAIAVAAAFFAAPFVYALSGIPIEHALKGVLLAGASFGAGALSAALAWTSRVRRSRAC